MKPTPISLPDDLREYAKSARRPGESLAAYIRRLIHEDRERKDRQNDRTR